MKRQGLEGLGELIDQILYDRAYEVNTRELTEFLKSELLVQNPDNAKIYYAQQVSTRPPTFVCFVNDPKRVHFSVKRHLINGIRTRWGYMGSPVRLMFKRSKKREVNPAPKKK